MDVLEKKIAIIGVGNCGSQVAALGSRKYPSLFDSIYINTSKGDLDQTDGNDKMKFKIGDDDEVEGSGKNRTKMKEYLQGEIENLLTDGTFTDTICEKRYVFVVASTAGGTGSGAAPALTSVLAACFPDVKFVLVAVLPQIQASLMEQGNALEFLQEMYDDMGPDLTYMIYDNETASDKSPTEALDYVNDAIVEDIRIITRVDNFGTTYDTIDEADLEGIMRVPGRLLITRVIKNLTEKILEDTLIDDIVIKTIKQSCHTETDRNKRVVKWGHITYFTDEVNKLYRSDFEKLQDFIGTPIERHYHHAINKGHERENFFYLIASGLSPINDRVTKIKDRIDELKAAMATDDKNQYVLSGDNASYDAMEQRQKEARRRNNNQKVDPSGIINKFMKKPQ